MLWNPYQEVIFNYLNRAKNFFNVLTCENDIWYIKKYMTLYVTEREALLFLNVDNCKILLYKWYAARTTYLSVWHLIKAFVAFRSKGNFNNLRNKQVVCFQNYTYSICIYYLNTRKTTHWTDWHIKKEFDAVRSIGYY